MIGGMEKVCSRFLLLTCWQSCMKYFSSVTDVKLLLISRQKKQKHDYFLVSLSLANAAHINLYLI